MLFYSTERYLKISFIIKPNTFIDFAFFKFTFHLILILLIHTKKISEKITFYIF